MPRLTPEDELTGWLRRHMPGGVLLGDDTAFLPSLGPVAVTVDQQIAGTHFPVGLAPAWLARRALEVTLSDLAASAARPRYLFLSISAPAEWPYREFFTAFGKACERHGVELGGGDLASAPRVSLSLCAIGDRPPRSRFVRRDAAQPGDHLWIGGSLGVSALGHRLVAAGARPEGRSVSIPGRCGIPRELLPVARRAVRRHLAPRAQLQLGAWLGRRRRTAAIDVSDGLALDLARLCEESEVGASLDSEALELEVPMRPLAARLDLDPREAVLGGGEDYVLLFALPPGIRPPSALGCRVLGEIVAEVGLRLDDGPAGSLEPSGWSHL